MRKKAVRYAFPAAGAAVVLLALLLLISTRARVSEPAQAIITTMLTAPNADLISGSPAWSPSDPPLTELEKEERKAQDSAAFQNWEDAVGGYFCDGGLRDFLMNQGFLLQHLARDSGVATSVSRMALEEKTDRYEEVLVTMLIGGAPHEIHVTIRYNPDGSVYKVRIDELDQLSGLFLTD